MSSAGGRGMSSSGEAMRSPSPIEEETVGEMVGS